LAPVEGEKKLKPFQKSQKLRLKRDYADEGRNMHGRDRGKGKAHAFSEIKRNRKWCLTLALQKKNERRVGYWEGSSAGNNGVQEAQGSFRT